MGMGYKNYHWHYNWVGMSFGHFANFGTCPASREFGICQTYVWQLFNYFKSLTGQVLLLNMTSDTLFLWLGHVNYGWATVLNVATKWKEFMSDDEQGDGINSSRVGVGGSGRQKLPVMMGAHPMPSGRESISLFWTFNWLTNYLRIQSWERPLQCNLLKYVCLIFYWHI